MLISAHIPKTGGTSFRVILERSFKERLKLDYDDHPLAHSTNLRNESASTGAFSTHSDLTEHFDCIHGHFLPLKYSGIKNAQFITWLRDPVQRLVSRYLYGKWTWESGSASPRQEELKAFIEKRRRYPSLEQFVGIETFQNTYSKYFWGFDVQQFEVIALVERWDESIDRLHYLLGEIVDAEVHINQNLNQEDLVYEVAETTRRLIENANQADVKMYAEVLKGFH